MRIRKTTIWAATAAILAAFGPSYAQEAGDAHDHDHSGGAQSQTSEMPEKCQAMMAAANQIEASLACLFIVHLRT